METQRCLRGDQWRLMGSPGMNNSFVNGCTLGSGYGKSQEPNPNTGVQPMTCKAS